VLLLGRQLAHRERHRRIFVSLPSSASPFSSRQSSNPRSLPPRYGPPRGARRLSFPLPPPSSFFPCLLVSRSRSALGVADLRALPFETEHQVQARVQRRENCCTKMCFFFFFFFFLPFPPLPSSFRRRSRDARYVVESGIDARVFSHSSFTRRPAARLFPPSPPLSLLSSLLMSSRARSY